MAAAKKKSTKKKTTKKAASKKKTAATTKSSSKVNKKVLSDSQEFEVLKLVLDKFLWLGFAIMAFGLYRLFQMQWQDGLVLMLAGIVVLILFVYIIIKEYEIITE